jgi:hypothetical protein
VCGAKCGVRCQVCASGVTFFIRVCTSLARRRIVYRLVRRYHVVVVVVVVVTGSVSWCLLTSSSSSSSSSVVMAPYSLRRSPSKSLRQLAIIQTAHDSVADTSKPHGQKTPLPRTPRPRKQPTHNWCRFLTILNHLHSHTNLLPAA